MLTPGQGFGQSSGVNLGLGFPSELARGSGGEALCQRWVGRAGARILSLLSTLCEGPGQAWLWF